MAWCSVKAQDKFTLVYLYKRNTTVKVEFVIMWHRTVVILSQIFNGGTEENR
jgi:hypothetical protein